MIVTISDYYKKQNATQQQLDKGIEGVRAMYSPFGQFTYGIGTTMLIGLLISALAGWIMQRKK
jgi:NhaP-type Na+/H+ or K+/H+ antiporter